MRLQGVDTVFPSFCFFKAELWDELFWCVEVRESVRYAQYQCSTEHKYWARDGMSPWLLLYLLLYVSHVFIWNIYHRNIQLQSDDYMWTEQMNCETWRNVWRCVMLWLSLIQYLLLATSHTCALTVTEPLSLILLSHNLWPHTRGGNVRSFGERFTSVEEIFQTTQSSCKLI